MIRFTDSGIEVNGVEKPLYSGSIHYWRMKKEIWSVALEHIKDMGFEIVETYVPWSVHEYEEGRYDFGELESSRDLDGFLSLCEEMGLQVIIRPGPHINAEMTLFGYPEWILMDREIQAENPWGTTVVYPYVTKQFPIPSYSSEKLYSKTEAYFMQLKPILRRHIGDNGCIILIQVDNETCNFFRDNPYIMDYSKASIDLYHHFLLDKYKSVEVLNEIYRTAYSDFEQISAPWSFQGKNRKDLPYYFDWVEYKEYQILYALQKIRLIIEKLELGIPTFHNCAYQEHTPISVQRDEQIPGLDVSGMDAYPEIGDTSMLRRRIRYLAGSSRLPYVPEFGSGSWFDRQTLLSPEEEEFGYLYSFMNGLKAVNFYMLVERDRWTGCPITKDGRIRRQYYDMFKNLIAMLRKNEIHRYKRRPRILILKNYDMGRFKALYSSLDLNPLTSNCFINGPDIPQELFVPKVELELDLYDDAGAYWSEGWVDRISALFDAKHYDYNYSDQYLLPENWENYDVIAASTYGFMDRKMQQQLVDFSMNKSKTIVIGPYIPRYDKEFGECTIIKDQICEAGSSNILLLTNLEGFNLNHLGVKNRFVCENPQVEIVMHEDPWNDECFMLYAANKSGEIETAEICFEKPYKALGIWRQEGYCKGRNLTLTLAAHSVQIWKMEMEGSR